MATPKCACARSVRGLPAGGVYSNAWAVKVREASIMTRSSAALEMVFLTYFFASAGCAEQNENHQRKMGYRYSGRSVAAFMCAALLPLLGAAQCTVFKKDGSQLGVYVEGAANGQLRYTYDPSLGKSAYLNCPDVLAYIDEALMVHGAPCDAANGPSADPTKKNCASLILRDNSVVKGRIDFMDGYAKVHALSGDRTVQESDIVGQITESDGVMFQNVESARSLMTNPTVIRAINDIAQCPASVAQVKTGYSLNKARVKFDAGKKKAAIAKAKAAAPPPGVTVVNYKDTVTRGLLEELDFDTFNLIALKKVERLGLYIHQIADKKMSMTLRDKAARQGMDLFENPLTNVVQVSKLIKGNPAPTLSNKKVVNYLQTDLKYNNKYDEVDIQWADLNYASDFEQQPDGSYQAVISVQQRFVGMVDGVQTYSDVTNKNVTVTLRQYEKLTDDGFKKLWDVFLGDIGVSSTQPG